MARERNYISKMYIIKQRDINLVFNQVRASSLILLNYKCGRTGREGVNATLIDHIQQRVPRPNWICHVSRNTVMTNVSHYVLHPTFRFHLRIGPTLPL